MNCGEYCALCYKQQYIKINFSKFHGICDEHFKTASCMLKCIHCGSIAPFLLPKYKCISCSKPCNELSSTCIHPMCSTCQIHCKYCPNCDDYQGKEQCEYCLEFKDLVESGCRHKICNDCWGYSQKCPVCNIETDKESNIHDDEISTHSIHIENRVDEHHENNFEGDNLDEAVNNAYEGNQEVEHHGKKNIDEGIYNPPQYGLHMQREQTPNRPEEAGFFYNLLMLILLIITCFWIFGFCFYQAFKENASPNNFFYKLSCIRHWNRDDRKRVWQNCLIWDCCNQPPPNSEAIPI